MEQQAQQLQQQPPPAPLAPLQAQQQPQALPELLVGASNKPTSSTSGGRVLDPSGSICHHWSMVVSLAFLYNFWSLSYRFAFREIDFDTVAFWFALDYSADLIYLLDVVFNFHTGYLEDGVLQRDVAKIGQHYRDCTRFYLDCFCLLPLDILYLSIGFNSILRCTRLVKIYKFWSYVDRTERHTNYPNVFRTFTLVHYILVIFHWNACLFHMISKNKLLDIENLYKINDNRCADVLCQYLHAFYWSTLALTTVGDLPRPRTKGEYIYVIVELFFGLFLFASVLGHVANIVTNVSAARKEFQAKLDAVKTFMRMRRVSDELQSKVIRWFDYLWSSQESADEDKSVACLPDRLKAEIAIHVHLDTLKRVDIFQNTEAGFLCELVLRLKPVLFSPGDYVCRKDEVGHEMYIVSRGILEVVTNEGQLVVATLKAGSYFGEISVLSVGAAGNRRTASVRSVGYSDLFCLNKQDLWDVLKDYPNAEARIRARAEERLSKLKHQQPALSYSDEFEPEPVAVHKLGQSGPWAARAPRQRAGRKLARPDETGPPPPTERRSARAPRCRLQAAAGHSTGWGHANLGPSGHPQAACNWLDPLGPLEERHRLATCPWAASSPTGDRLSGQQQCNCAWCERFHYHHQHQQHEQQARHVSNLGPRAAPTRAARQRAKPRTAPGQLQHCSGCQVGRPAEGLAEALGEQFGVACMRQTIAGPTMGQLSPMSTRRAHKSRARSSASNGIEICGAPASAAATNDDDDEAEDGDEEEDEAEQGSRASPRGEFAAEAAPRRPSDWRSPDGPRDGHDATPPPRGLA